MFVTPAALASADPSGTGLAASVTSLKENVPNAPTVAMLGADVRRLANESTKVTAACSLVSRADVEGLWPADTRGVAGGRSARAGAAASTPADAPVTPTPATAASRFRT